MVNNDDAKYTYKIQERTMFLKYNCFVIDSTNCQSEFCLLTVWGLENKGLVFEKF